jgi:predicted small metal-binding protein
MTVKGSGKKEAARPRVGSSFDCKVPRFTVSNHSGSPFPAAVLDFPQQLSIFPHSAHDSRHNTSRRQQMANITQPDRTNKGNEQYSFRCADAGFATCPWEAKGATPEDVLKQAEQHGREQHHLTSIDDQTRNLVRSKIRMAA